MKSSKVIERWEALSLEWQAEPIGEVVFAILVLAEVIAEAHNETMEERWRHAAAKGENV